MRKRSRRFRTGIPGSTADTNYEAPLVWVLERRSDFNQSTFSSLITRVCAASRISPLCGITLSIPNRPVDNFVERDEGGVHLPRSGSGWRGCVSEALQELLDRRRTLFDRGTLAVRERDLDQHALQVALRLQQLRLTGVFGNVEVAARAGHAVWALLEEAVAAISMAKIEVLPRCT